VHGFLVDLAVLAVVLAVAAIAGKLVERRHLRSLRDREANCRDLTVTNLPPPGPAFPDLPPRLVTAEVVLAVDALTAFVTRLRKHLGGRLEPHRRLLERARREAVLRLLEAAREAGYGAVTNLRVTAIDLGGRERGGLMTRVGIVATATAAPGSDGKRAAWLDAVPPAAKPLPPSGSTVV
jgi:uncharacterized protein YbjQ (UPF0145 family)